MKHKIIEILTDVRPDTDFTKSSDFIREGMLDSFDVITLVARLEEEFGVLIENSNFSPENFSSIEAIEALLTK